MTITGESWEELLLLEREYKQRQGVDSLPYVYNILKRQLV
jgi:hypothetical protein